VFGATLLGALLALGSPSPRQWRGGQGVRLPSWLSGCWEQRAENRVIEERWTAPRGGSMLGMGSTYRGDSLVESEWVVLRAQAGELSYEAHPSGQPTATFTAREISDSSVVFENPA